MIGTLLKLAGGVVLGAAVGMAIGRLVAPSSGEELVERIQAFRDEIITAGKQAEEERRVELQSRFAQAKQFRPPVTLS